MLLPQSPCAGSDFHHSQPAGWQSHRLRGLVLQVVAHTQHVGSCSARQTRASQTRRKPGMFATCKVLCSSPQLGHSWVLHPSDDQSTDGVLIVQTGALTKHPVDMQRLNLLQQEPASEG